jgi:hypothetical protein
MTPSAHKSPSAVAQTLGYGGLVPFVGFALAVWLLPPAQQARAAQALLGYSVSILSFLGAIHWGLAMRNPSRPSPGMLVWGVVPSLVAWLALLLPAPEGLLLVVALLWACFAVDSGVYPRMGLRAWLPMRLTLTTVASACCIASVLRWPGAAA